MPLYEYYCQPCHGIFEELRPMREATEPVPCPECYQDAERIMPTSFSAFVFRDGYPRRIPDDGKYWHLGQKVSKRVSRGRPNEHPEINKPKPKQRLSKGDREKLRDMRVLAQEGNLVDLYDNPIKPGDVKAAVERRDIIKQGSPNNKRRTPKWLKDKS